MSVREIKRGDVYWAELPKLDGSSIQSGLRPVIIVSNDYACKYSPTIQYVPVTTRVKKCRLPVQIPLNSNIFPKRSVALVEQQGIIDKSMLREYIGYLPYSDLKHIDRAIMTQFDLVGVLFNQKIIYNSSFIKRDKIGTSYNK